MRTMSRIWAILLCLCLIAPCAALAEETALALTDATDYEVVSAPLEAAPEEEEFALQPDAPQEEAAEETADVLAAIDQPKGYSVGISSYDVFRNETMGKSYNLDGKNGAQCWDGAALLWSQLGMTLSTGKNNAKGCWLNAREYNAGDQFDLIYNLSDVRRGDVVVLNVGKVGHIGFADEDYYSNMAFISMYGQNQGKNANNEYGLPFSTLSNYYKSSTFLGAFRYKGWAGIPISAEHFPDETFRNYVSGHYDTDNNGRLSDAERNVVTYIDVNDRKDIKDLTGISCFENMTYLYCTNCGLTSLDVSGCPKLQELYCSDNTKLKTLNVNGCEELYMITCNNCSLSELDLGNCTALDYLEVDKNRLTTLDISKTNIWRLWCKDNQLKKLTLNKECKELQCNGNKLSKLDISKCQDLVTLREHINEEDGDARKVSKGVIRYECEHTMDNLAFDAYTRLIVNGKRVDGWKNVPTSVKLNKSGTVELKMTDTLKLKATIKPTSAVPYVSWKSLDTKVAKVSSSGKVTPVKPGTATIKVSTYNGKTAKVKVKVVPVKPSKVTITKGKEATIQVGGKLTLKAKLLPAGATSKLTWKSSDTKVATVSSSGVVKAKKAGTATITVKTANGKKATITITVKAKYSIGSIVTFGRYDQDSNDYNGKEPIKWIVLANDGDTATLVSKYALLCTEYDYEGISVTWETCTLRKWLNNTFYYAAFNEKERKRIKTFTVKNKGNPDYGTWGGNDTQDKVFLLSIDEANRYFASDSARVCKPTKTAIGYGAWTIDSSACWWWLRSPGLGTSRAAYVSSGGSVSISGDFVDHERGAIRPVVVLRLS